MCGVLLTKDFTGKNVQRHYICSSFIIISFLIPTATDSSVTAATRLKTSWPSYPPTGQC